MTTNAKFRVVIAGGGVAALEAALALRELAGERVAVQLLAPNAEFSFRPLTVREPFANAPANRYPVAEIAADIGAELIVDGLASVDPAARTAHTVAGVGLPYDALLLAVGATMRRAFDHALTIDDRRMDELLQGIVADVEGGYVRRLAFVAPARSGWPLPLYELALMTARRAYDMSMTPEITIVTPEQAPLEVFGGAVSSAVGGLLRESGVELLSSADVRVPGPGQLVLDPGGRRLQVDSVIALPELFGPAIDGLPARENGFLPVSIHGQVLGSGPVYAAGDATDYPIKQGGIAAQQADAVAETIAALAGAPISPVPFRPELNGVLFTGGASRYMHARVIGGAGVDAEISEAPIAGAAAKVSARYLTPYLERLDAVVAAR